MCLRVVYILILAMLLSCGRNRVASPGAPPSGPSNDPTGGIDFTNHDQVKEAYLGGRLDATRKADSAADCGADEVYFYCQQPGSSTDDFDYCRSNNLCPANKVHAAAWVDGVTKPGDHVDGNCCYCGACLRVD